MTMTLFDKSAPPTPTGASRLRPYQSEAVEAALRSENGLIVMPTGSGKSHIIAELVNQLPGDTLILQPSKEILESNFDKIVRTGATNVEIFSASMNRKRISRATYATIGSIIHKLDRFSQCKNVIVDEAHLVNAKGGMYEKLITTLQPKRLYGLTATPYRLHTNSWGAEIRLLNRTRPKLFDDIIYVSQCRDLIEQGFMRQPEYLVSEPGNTALLKLNSTGADYTEESIVAYLNAIDAVERVRQAAIDALRRGIEHILVFMPTVAISEDAAERLRDAGITAETVSARSNREEREKKLSGFKSGKITTMVNVRVLSIGYDFPGLDCIISARPTKSLALYYQIIGRCVRPLPGKGNPLVYDLVDNYSTFGDPMQMTIRRGRAGLFNIYAEDGAILNNETSRRIQEDQPKEPPGQVTFGKYKGKPISEVPLGYLQWCVKNFDNGKIKDTIKAEIKRRCVQRNVKKQVGT